MKQMTPELAAALDALQQRATTHARIGTSREEDGILTALAAAPATAEPFIPSTIDDLQAEASASAAARQILTPILKAVVNELPAGTHAMLAIVFPGIPGAITLATDRRQFIPPMQAWLKKVQTEGGEG